MLNHNQPKSRSRKNRPAERGFTLIEILIVIVLLGLMVALFGPKFFKKADKAKLDIARMSISMLENSINLFKLDTGRYPSQSEGMAALMNKPGDCNNWDGPYVEKGIPKDPWGRDFLYKVPGTRGPYDLYTLGADGQAGGDGANADIYNNPESK